MKVFLIAGHGAGDNGAVGNGYQEAVLTREMTELIPGYLAPYAQVTVGDTDRDWFSYLKSHSFDFSVYDYVLELHFNAGAGDETGDGRVTGSEIYVTTGEPGVTVEEAILENLEALGLTNRGVKRKNFSVIAKVRAQGTPAALLETAFVDDRDDMALYQEKKAAVAQAVARGIAQGFGLAAPAVPEEAPVNGGMIYDYIDDNMPEWARPTIQKLVNLGWLKGDQEGRLGLDTAMLRAFVVNDRAGLYG